MGELTFFSILTASLAFTFRLPDDNLQFVSLRDPRAVAVSTYFHVQRFPKTQGGQHPALGESLDTAGMIFAADFNFLGAYSVANLRGSSYSRCPTKQHREKAKSYATQNQYMVLHGPSPVEAPLYDPAHIAICLLIMPWEGLPSVGVPRCWPFPCCGLSFDPSVGFVPLLLWGLSIYSPL